MSFGDVFGGITDAFKLGYNLFTNQRDFDYQKALQQTMFEREDTAVQRRMEDLKAAGINPNLAAGSAAGAGSVVSRSNTNDLGSALDTMMAVNSIKAQKQQVENAQKEGEILDSTKQIKFFEEQEKAAELMYMFGLPTEIEAKVNGDGTVTPLVRYQNRYGMSEYFDFDKTPFYKQYKSNIDYMQNSSEYLQRQLNWFTADQLNNYLKTIGTFVPRVNFGFRK